MDVANAIASGLPVPGFQRLSRRNIPELALIFLAVAVFYVSLFAELGEDDTERFIASVAAGEFEWDAAHIWMQPATVLWHRYLSFGSTALMSQKVINTVATVAALTIFHALLIQLRAQLWSRIALTFIAAASFNLISLAPTGHMKLIAFPFLALSLWQAVAWEIEIRTESLAAIRWRLIVSGLSLGFSAALLLSCIVALPFAALAIFWLARAQARDPWWGLPDILLFLGLAGVAGALPLLSGFLAASNEPLGIGSFLRFVVGKNAEHIGLTSLVTMAARAVFSIVFNFVGVLHIGSIFSAWFGGLLSSLGPYALQLALGSLVFLTTAVIVAAIYLVALYRWYRSDRPLVMSLAFVLGAVTWGIYWNLNDPEHWFQLTQPTLLLAVVTLSARELGWLAAVLLPLEAGYNLAASAIPKASYPLASYEAELSRRFSASDLIVQFAAYPGRAYMGLVRVPGVPRLSLDTLYFESRDPRRFFAQAGATIDQTLAKGGQVVVFDVLDPHDWDAPWMLLHRIGLEKVALSAFLTSCYEVENLGKVAGLPAWQLRLPSPSRLADRSSTSAVCHR